MSGGTQEPIGVPDLGFRVTCGDPETNVSLALPRDSNIP